MTTTLPILASGEVFIPFAFLVFVFLIPLFWFISIYNSLVRLRQHVRESWSGIDTELKRRHDLIPNLVQTVKGYAAHERATLEAVVEARRQASAEHTSVHDTANDENALISALGRLFMVVEGYPELKASRNFLQLQQELVNTEDRIQAARRFYNANVRDLNTRIEVFPSNIVAGMFQFTQAEFFEIKDSSVREPVKVDLS